MDNHPKLKKSITPRKFNIAPENGRAPKAKGDANFQLPTSGIYHYVTNINKLYTEIVLNYVQKFPRKLNRRSRFLEDFYK